MPWAVAGGLAAGVGGSLVSGLLSPGTSGSSSYYVPTGLADSDTAWQNLLQGIYGDYNANAGTIGDAGLSSLNAGLAANGQYGSGYQSAANSAAAGYTNAGNALTTLGNSDLATQQQLLGAGQNVLNMGLDPNQAAYNLALSNLTQQTGATNSMYGLGSSAAGAGVQNQALSNFGINWNTQQLQNAESALSAYTGAANTAGSYGQAGGTALSLAPQYTLQGGQLPYSTAQSLAATPGSLASTYGSLLNSNLYGSAESIMSGIIPYLNNGQGAQALPYTTQANAAGTAGALTSSAISGLGNSIQNAGSLGNFLNGTTGSFGSGDFSGAFTSSPYYSGGGNSYGFTM